MLRLSFAKLNILVALVLSIAVLQAFSQSSTPFSVNSSPLPPTTFAVNDYAGVLDEATKQSIEKRLIEFRKNTNPKVEIGVAIVKTTGDRPIFDYSLAVARGWGIGDKGATNSSALLFIAVDDRKYFTQVSGGLQDELSDGTVGNLQRQYLVPAFKQGNYSKGVSDTIDAYISTINAKRSGEATPTPNISPTQSQAASGGICGFVICLVVIFLILIIIFSRRNPPGGGGGNGRWRGGGFGGGTSSALPWIIGSAIANSIGSSSSSSDWGGSSSSGGGESWGGFGGGGGGFDGGGSGGSW